MRLIDEVNAALSGSIFGREARVQRAESGPMSTDFVSVVRGHVVIEFATDRGTLMIACRSPYAPLLYAPLEFVLRAVDAPRTPPPLAQSPWTVATALAEIDAELPRLTRAFRPSRAAWTLWRARRLWFGYNRKRYAPYGQR